MTNGVATLVFPTTDLDAAKALITMVAGVEPHTDQPYYVGWNVNGLEVALNPNGHAMGMTGGTNYWAVDDVAAAQDELVAAGATLGQPATEVGGGTVIGTVTDKDGNVIGLIART
jgi:predicted enzyme related to lactoylglutathione lyase